MLIAAAGNVEAPAFLVLESKGFRVERTVDNASDTECWSASKGDLRFLGDSPLQVLGLVAMHEARGNEWFASDPEIDRFHKQFNLRS
jgi:hypothetical protein